MTATPIAWTPTIHPFTRDGELDEAGFCVLARRLADAGVHLNVPNEGQGENWVLSDAEVRRLMELAKTQAAGRVRVTGMGRQAHTAEEHVRFIELCQSVGLDGVMIYPLDIGHGIHPTEREMEAYLGEVLAAGRIPMQIEILASAGYHYPLRLLRKMADRFEHVRGLMVVTPDQRYLRDARDALGDRLEIHAPSHAQLFGYLQLGIRGFSFPIANLIPRTCLSVLELYAAGRYPEMQAAFERVERIRDRIADFNGTRDGGRSEAVKAALNILGLPGGYPRRPRLPVPDERLPELARVIEELGIAELESTASSRATREEV